MELLPTSSPVYGGGVIMTFLPEDYILPPSIRAFLVFKGSKEQQITEAGISYELNAFQAIIPDHEPPEDVYLSVYILFSSGDCKCIATEGFQFYLDQTCFLARYLADSIHNVESLEDWDCIRGEAFCLQKENFTTLDNRLTPAFKHLILPSNWNLLGGPEIRHVQRETLFHFAGRLGLVDFATFLLQKNGAEECLKLKNRSNELAASVARVHGNGDLAYLFSNPHKHKKPTWAEEAKWIYPESTIRRSNYDKMSITVRLNPSTGEKIPHTENQIQHFSRTSQPPQVSISYDLNNEVIDMEHHTQQQQTTTTRQQHVQQQHYYDVDVDENEGIAGMLDEYCQERNIGLYAGTSSSTVDDYHPLTPIDTPSTSLSPPGYSKMDPYGSDVARQTPEEVERDRSKRISLSCPDLAQDEDHMKKDQIGVDTGGDPRMSVPRNRSAIQVGLNDGSSDMEMRVGGNSELSPTRRHSWHSSESLHVDADVDDISPTINFTYPDEDVGRRNLQQSSSSVSEDIEMINSPTTNQLHGVVQRRNNEEEDFTTFAVINKMPTTVADALSQKQKLGMRQRGMSYPVLNTDNLSANDKQSATTEDRRYTICEGQQPNNSSSSSCINTTSTLAQQDHNLQSASHSTPYLNSTNDGPHQHLPQQRSLQETTTTKKNNEILPRSDHVRPPVPPKPKLPSSGMSVQILPHTSPIVEKSIPIVPPPPQPDPPEKKIITRKISFLKQLRSSKIKKTAKNKAKMQPPTVQEDDSDKNEVGGVDNKNSSNQQLKLKGHHHHQRGAVGGNNGDVVGGQQRPQSMMINRPPQYPVGNPAGHRPQQRPQSTIYSSGRYGSNSVTNNSLDSVFQRPVSESPDEIEDPDDEFEEELLMKQNEAEAWSITVDKKTIKKMGKKDIKRQEIIYEFIQTERNYLATLIIMQKIFARGMSEELQLDPSTINKLFPYIDEHVKFVRKFVKLLLERQQDNKLVRRIGDLFLAHWSGSSGDEMKKLFGAFCSCNNEMNAMYKELNKNDKKFAAFVKKVKEDLRTKRKGIPECYLLVTQRITKYPIMVQTLLENTNKKENQEDHRDIEQALDLSRQIAKGVDEQVRDRERLLKLQDIHEKTDPRSSTIVKGRKFDRKDFFARNRKLSFCSDTVQLKVQRNKPIDVFLVVLSDCIVVLHENNGKYFFVTTTIAVLKLKKLILREVAYHNLGLLLINAASADMIEIRFSSSDLRKKMISLIRTAVGHCPEDGPDSDDDADSERQSQESKIKSEKWNELFTKLHEKDEQMAQVMEERINCFKQYQPHILSSSNIDGGDTAIFYPMLHHSKSEYDEGRLQFPPTAPLLQTLADFAGKLSNSMSEYSGEEDDDVNLLGNNISLSPKQQTNEQTTTTSIMTSSSSSELLTTKHHHQQQQHGGSSDSSDTSPDISSAPKSSWVTGDSPTRDHVTSVENGGSMTSLRSYSTYHMLESMKQLSILCNNYISHAQQQDSYVAKLYSIMEQERSRKHKPGNLLEEAELKRNQVKQEEQLDELRKEQQKLKSQQDNFERYKERQMRNIEQQDKKLEEQKAELQRASDKNNSDRDEIQLQKEELQRELGRVRAMRKSDNNQQTTTMTSSLPGSVPPSSTSSTASLLMNKNNSSSNNQARSSSMSRVVMGEQSSSSSSSVTSSTRSSSLRAASPTPPSGSASGDYLRASKRGEMTSSSSAMSELPIHLQYSATNQMTAGRTTAQQQQLFTKNLSKLAKNDGKTSKESKHHHHHTKSSLSSKLSSLSSGGNQQQQTTNCNTTTGASRLLMPPTTTTHRHHQKQLSEPQQLFAMRRPNSPRLLMSGGTSTNNLSTLRHLPYPTITTTASGAPPHMTSSSPPTSYPSSTTTADIGAATNIGRRSDAARRQSSASSSGSGPRLSAKRRGGHSTNSSDREEDIELFL